MMLTVIARGMDASSGRKQRGDVVDSDADDLNDVGI